MKKHFHLWLTLVVVLLVVTFSARPTQAQSQRPVLAYYYAWWSPDSVGPGKSPDWPINPYHSWDTGVMAQHVAQIAGAGIDGMVVAWYGPTEANNQTETNFRTLLDLAAANGITALLSVDLGSGAWFTSVQEVIDGLNYALSVHANHPAYFRYNGRPVLFFWYQGRYSLDDWAYIRQQVDPDHNSIWIAEGAMPDAMPTFDGLHMYTISWAENVYATESQWAATTRSRGGIWVGTAMPGWDNTLTPQSERYVRERADGAFLRETFSAAAATAPEMLLITSWNEWWESTHIEPSALYGDSYLNLTRELVAQYHASGAVAGGGGAPPPSEPTPLPTEPAPVEEVGPGPVEFQVGSAEEAEAELADERSSSTPLNPTPTSKSTEAPTSTPAPTAAQVVLAVPTPAAVAEVMSGESGGRMSGDALVGDNTPDESDVLFASPGERLILALSAVLGLVGVGLTGFGWFVLRKRVTRRDDPIVGIFDSSQDDAAARSEDVLRDEWNPD
jgi:hypothetical protein